MLLGRSNPSVKETTTATFTGDVLVASQDRPVLVDFWAPWCGPCKQLAPALERAVKAAEGRVTLVKMNIDDHPEIAGQLGIQSVPAVIAFDQGKPVDGFVGALPEKEIVAFIDRLTGPVGGLHADDIGAVEQALVAGDAGAALDGAAALLDMAPDDPAALALYARALLAAGDLDAARRHLEAIAPALRADPILAQAIAAVELAAQGAAVAAVEPLIARLEADPADHHARFDLALALNARGRRQEAADALLALMARDRSWNEDGARKQLLQFFESWGPLDPATRQARRKLSSVLFS